MIHLRQLPVIMTIDIPVLVSQLIPFHGGLGVHDGHVDAKEKDHKAQGRRDAGIRLHVQFREHDNLIEETEFLRVSDRRGFGMELFHLEGHDVFTLFLFAVVVVATVHVAGLSKKKINLFFGRMAVGSHLCPRKCVGVGDCSTRDVAYTQEVSLVAVLCSDQRAHRLLSPLR